MELREAIQGRRSIRGFDTTRPVPREILEEILRLAVRAPSGENAQPWEFHVVTGAVLDAIRASNTAYYEADAPVSRVEAPVPDGIYRERGREVGKLLLTSMGIARDDRERRHWWRGRGYRFFDAPAAILICMDACLDETAYRLDIGCAAQTICLAAMDYGLGTCIEDQALTYQEGARKYLHLPEDRILACGIAVGYPNPAFAANHVRSPRADIGEITTWHGF